MDQSTFAAVDDYLETLFPQDDALTLELDVTE